MIRVNKMAYKKERFEKGVLKGRLEVKQYEAWKRVDQGKQKGIKKREDQERNKKGQYSATINTKKKIVQGYRREDQR